MGLAANETEKEKRALEEYLELCLNLEVQCALRLKVPGFAARSCVPSQLGCSLPVRQCRRPLPTQGFHLQNNGPNVKINELKGLSGPMGSCRAKVREC